MSILGKIFGAIFNRKPARPAAPPPAPQPNAAPVAVAPTPAPVDLEAVLDEMNAERAQRLNWRTSIVDLMKLVGMESSLAERKALADELGYRGDKSDSAAMNIWLHDQVMRKLKENGGRTPPELLD